MILELLWRLHGGLPADYLSAALGGARSQGRRRRLAVNAASSHLPQNGRRSETISRADETVLKHSDV